MRNEQSEEDMKKKAQDSENAKDMWYLLLAVIGTLLFISSIMVSYSLLLLY